MPHPMRPRMRPQDFEFPTRTTRSDHPSFEFKPRRKKPAPPERVRPRDPTYGAYAVRAIYWKLSDGTVHFYGDPPDVSSPAYTSQVFCLSGDGSVAYGAVSTDYFSTARACRWVNGVFDSYLAHLEPQQGWPLHPSQCSDDGSVIIGAASSGYNFYITSNPPLAYWSNNGATTHILDPSPHGVQTAGLADYRAISYDGRTIYGQPVKTNAAFWRDGVPTLLPYNTNAYTTYYDAGGGSADGSTAFLQGGNLSGVAYARTSNGVVVPLSSPAGIGGYKYGRAATADGKVIYGANGPNSDLWYWDVSAGGGGVVHVVSNTVDGQGVLIAEDSTLPNPICFTRDDTLGAVRFTGTTQAVIGNLPGGHGPWVQSCSGDGSIAVGTAIDSSNVNQQVYWTSDLVPHILPQPSGGWQLQGYPRCCRSGAIVACSAYQIIYIEPPPPISVDLSLRLAKLDPMLLPDSVFTFNSDDEQAEMGASFPQFSFAAWCCKNVQLRWPDVLDTPPAGTFHALPLGSYISGNANNVSANGHVSVGWVSPDGTFQQACYWTDLSGPTIIAGTNPTVGDNAQAYGVSGNGSIIVGVILLPHTPMNFSGPFRWSAAGGLVPFDTVPGSANTISADGTRIAGFVHPGGPTAMNTSSACYWDASTLVRTLLPNLPGCDNGTAFGISANGQTIVGACWSGGNYQYSRAFRWTAATGTIDLGLPLDDGNAVGAQAQGVSDDGNVVAGDYSTSGRGGTWRWTPSTGMLTIPMRGLAFQNAVAGNGFTILGSDNINGYYVGYMSSTGVWVPVPIAFDPTHPDNLQYTAGYGISADGKTIVGATSDGSNIPFVYYVAGDGQPYGLLWMSPTGANVEFRDQTQTLLFSGTFDNPNADTAADQYQFCFAIDTQAQTVICKGNGITWPGRGFIWGAPGDIGNCVVFQ